MQLQINDTYQYKIKGPLQPRKRTTEIVLHCAATPENKDYTVENIEAWHLSRGFSTIGYHFVIYRDGSIHRGREEDTKGAHESKVNASSIGVCYIGGCDKSGKVAKDTRTEEQRRSLLELVDYLLSKYHLTINDIHCHNEYTAVKACPSFKIKDFRDEYIKWKDAQYAAYLKDKNAGVRII